MNVKLGKGILSIGSSIMMALFTHLPSAAIVPETVYTVQVEGQKRDIVELVEVKHCGTKRHWYEWWKTTEDYHVYRLLSEGDHIILNDKQFKAVKSELKQVPDNRTYEMKYPFKTEAQHDLNTALGVVITVVQTVR